MDHLDRKIIAELVDDGRISATELAERISLSLSATSQRLKRILESGVVRRVEAQLDPDRIGRPIDALVDLQLDHGSPFSALDDELAAEPAVVDAMHVTGPFDYVIRVRCHTISDLDRLLRRLKEDFAVSNTSTRIVLATGDGFPRQPAVL